MLFETHEAAKCLRKGGLVSRKGICKLNTVKSLPKKLKNPFISEQQLLHLALMTAHITYLNIFMSFE